MSQHDPLVLMGHMRDFAAAALRMSSGRAFEDLDADEMFRFALTHAVELVGEAAGGVGDEARQAHPGIPWRDIVALRNRLIHGYAVVDHGVLWEIVQKDLPALLAQLDAILPPSPTVTDD